MTLIEIFKAGKRPDAHGTVVEITPAGEKNVSAKSEQNVKNSFTNTSLNGSQTITLKASELKRKIVI